MFYFYVLQAKQRKLYFGSTNDLKRRLGEHNCGASRATRGKRWTLVYYEAYISEADARMREKQIKAHGQAKRWLKSRIQNSLK